MLPITLPIIALVGRPNVGKSTLFNCLTGKQDALVADFPGLTRDRLYGQGQLGDSPYMIVDTGGLMSQTDSIDTLMNGQTWLAAKEADHVLWLVDARAGLTADDHYIAQRLRQMNKSVTVVVNKTDHMDPDVVISEFFSLGFGQPIAIAATHRRGVSRMMEIVLTQLSSMLVNSPSAEQPQTDDRAIHIAVVGRPNVGKSTLVNRLLGEERVTVYDQPGTTRDSIYIPFSYHSQPYVLIDTAGMRKRGRVREKVEQFSVIKTLQAIRAAHVVVMLCDATEGITDQDLNLLGLIINSGRALVCAVNKWDGLPSVQRAQVNKDLERRMGFINFARLQMISAKYGTGVGHLYDWVKEAYDCAHRSLSTSQLTALLHEATQAHPPPYHHRTRVKLSYAHSGGTHPPCIVIHGNQTQHLSQPYHRYLINRFRQALKLKGTPIKLTFKNSDNPFKGQKNQLTLSQQKRRSKVIRHRKQQDKRRQQG